MLEKHLRLASLTATIGGVLAALGVMFFWLNGVMLKDPLHSIRLFAPCVMLLIALKAGSGRIINGLLLVAAHVVFWIGASNYIEMIFSDGFPCRLATAWVRQCLVALPALLIAVASRVFPRWWAEG